MPVEDETGPCNGVKGAVDVYDPPLEARVPRLDRCCLKQKVGYSRDTAPKNDLRSSKQPLLCREGQSLRPPVSENFLVVWIRLWARHGIQVIVRAGIGWRVAAASRTSGGE